MLYFYNKSITALIVDMQGWKWVPIDTMTKILVASMFKDV